MTYENVLDAVAGAMQEPGMLTGRVFSRLTVVSQSPVRTGARRMQWNCKCECGATVIVTGNNLLTGRTKSCGCLKRDTAGDARRDHGLSDTHEHWIWRAMKQRCTNQKVKGYENYGGRGIYVCERWMKSFSDFLEDMGPRPEGLWLERKDNDGPYAPWNCKWATYEEQMKNKRPRRDRKVA